MDEAGAEQLDVFVPELGSELRQEIWPGSGIVGRIRHQDARLRIDFEGDRERFPLFIDRIRRAADRHDWAEKARRGYPTRACAYVSPREVKKVGQYCPVNGTVAVTDQEALAEWLEVDNPDQLQLGREEGTDSGSF